MTLSGKLFHYGLIIKSVAEGGLSNYIIRSFDPNICTTSSDNAVPFDYILDNALLHIPDVNVYVLACLRMVFLIVMAVN